MERSLDAILEEISLLGPEDQELLGEILHKRVREGKRAEIQAAYCAALEDRKQGRLTSGSVDDLFGALDSC